VTEKFLAEIQIILNNIKTDIAHCSAVAAVM